MTFAGDDRRRGGGRADNTLRLRSLGIDTHQEPVLFMRSDCSVCRSVGFTVQSRVLVAFGARHAVATIAMVDGDLLQQGEAALSESARRALGAHAGDEIAVSHAPEVGSLSDLRAKVFGHRLDDAAMRRIVGDIVAGNYSPLHLAAFVTACAGERLDTAETLGLARAMIGSGERIVWPQAPVMDKHCVGGLPGNRTTLIVVPIVAAAGLTIPKTSSRAITSPAGTADTMETLAPVALTTAMMRRVVEREGGCIVWGGAVALSPADDVLIRVERPLDLDGEGQLVASVLSKKVAAGATHVLIDMPVGPTVKVRSAAAAARLAREMRAVGQALGLAVEVAITDGGQPVGRGIGPALEARDVLAVLQESAQAPADLRERALQLAGAVLEMGGRAPPRGGRSVADALLRNGSAWAKFQAICAAQGGMRVPARAPHTRPFVARRDGRVGAIDNRRLARIAKLAGAPQAPAAGVEFLAPLGTRVVAGQPLFVVHAEGPGELAYAFDYLMAQVDVVAIEEC
jgi:thymidine phosphorylase